METNSIKPTKKKIGTKAYFINPVSPPFGPNV